MHFYHSGPYPATFKTSHNPLQDKDKEDENLKSHKTGEIHWSNAAWTAILQHATFLHVNVAGKNAEDLDTIRRIATDLNLTHHNKINFNFNKTIDRGSYNSLNKEEKIG